MKKILLFIALFLFPGCSITTSHNVEPAVNFSFNQNKVTSTIVRTYDTTTIVSVPRDNTNITVEYSPKGKSVSQWAQSSSNPGVDQIIVNAAYFDVDNTPAGFLFVHNKRIGTKLFDESKTGLIQIKNSELTIRDLNIEPLKKNETFEYALQSYPFLIRNGEPAVSTDTQKYAQRSALGTDSKGNVYIIIDQGFPSLYQFAQKLKSSDITFDTVLNLDGGPSSGLYVKWNSTNLVHDSGVAVSSIIRIQQNFQK